MKLSLELVSVTNQQVMTTSLLVAEKFAKQHKNVLQKIDALIVSQPEFGRLNFKPIEYLDARNRPQKMYYLTEEGFAMIAMRFTGKAAEEWQIKFISAFQKMRKRLTSLERASAVKIKRDTARPMTDSLKFIRDELGKETREHHYANEHLFCNRAAFGKWEPVDEDALDVYDLKILEETRRFNALLIQRFPVQKDRKARLDEFVEKLRARNPKDLFLTNPRRRIK